jgi:hypothetical protein
MGSPDPRKDIYGFIDFWIQRQIKAYKTLDAPPLRFKPIPILVIIHVVEQSIGMEQDAGNSDIANMIVISFFFLLHPYEYTRTYSDDAAFNFKYVSLYTQGQRLDMLTLSDRELEHDTSTSYVFTTQKHGHLNKKAVQGVSGDRQCFPRKAIAP